MIQDRREIVRLLLPHFPELAEATSQEVQAFLNLTTGLSIPGSEPNGEAFDKWRRALADIGYEGVWGYTPAQMEEFRVRAEVLKRLTDERLTAEIAAFRLANPGKPLPPVLATAEERMAAEQAQQ